VLSATPKPQPQPARPDADEPDGPTVSDTEGDAAGDPCPDRRSPFCAYRGVREPVPFPDGRLTTALSVDENDGLAHRAAPEVLADWRARLVAAEKPRRRHPVFFHDRGLRLATQLRADTAEFTSADLAQATVSVLDHLVKQA
jgi:hypothetical protein